MDESKTIITLCMGSSCFSRGNNLNVEMVKKYLLEENLTAQVDVRGCLCEGHCKVGPNITVNGELLQGVDPQMVFDLLKHKLAKAPQ